MGIGTLQATVVLDSPGKTHYGSTDPVTGFIKLTFRPSTKGRADSSPELFGPLQVAVTFHGRAKTKIWKKQGNSTHIYRGRAPLFALSKRIYDDSFKAQPYESNAIPFELYFPEAAQATIDSVGWDSDQRFDFQPGDPLPPTFSDSYYGFTNRYETFVEYRVGVDVAMRGIQINIDTPDKDLEPSVQYERPPSATPISGKPLLFKGYESVKNELLLPEADRPTGFKQKAKAAFSSDFYPTYSFDWSCIAPQHIHIGQPIAFEVYIRPRDKECTAVVIPEVYLSNFTVDIKAFTVVRAERQLFSSPEAYSDEPRATLKGIVDNKGPFSKANDWVKTINTKDFVGICSEFKTYNISRRYKLKVKGVFTVAGKVKDFSQESSIVVYPPLQSTIPSVGPSSSAIAGPSTHPFGSGNAENALPQYERPPEYEEVLEEEPQTASGKAPQRDHVS